MKRYKALPLCMAVLSSVFLLCGMDGACNGFFPDEPSSPPATVQAKPFETQLIATEYGTGDTLSQMPIPYQPLYAVWQSDNTGAVGSLESFGSAPNGTSWALYTDGNGMYNPSNLRQNANWNLSYGWTAGCPNDHYYILSGSNLQPATPGTYYPPLAEVFNNDGTTFHIDCWNILSSNGTPMAGVMSPQYASDSSLPATVTTVSTNSLAQSGQTPQLYVYNRTGEVVGTSTASSVNSDGVTVTFPFPTPTSGSLPADFYGSAIISFDGNGNPSYAGNGGFFSIGHNDTSQTAPFGVAAGIDLETIEVCFTYQLGAHSESICNESDTDDHFPIVSLYQSGTLSWNGKAVAVGTNPTTVVAYGTGRTSTTTGSSTRTTIMQNGTAYALVVNSGSNTLSIVNLLTASVVATIPVGNMPLAAVVSTDASTAYVTNYADGTLSQINLSNYSVTKTVYVGPQLSAVAIDSGGNLWAAGSNTLVQLSASSLSTLQSTQVSGNITSLAVSNGSGQVVTTIQNSSATSSAVESYSTTLSSSATVIETQSSEGYFVRPQGNVVGGNVAQLGSGTVVSANYGNDLVINATPTGFVVTDLGTGGPFLTGTTPYPVMSIAVDPDFGFVYMTVPDGNSVLTLPLPPVPTS